ncbi:MAG: fimbrillin family protein [Bacteroidales bacterium]|nr:fimbrillin family protein [Bacteroidales bacterium]
MKRIPHILICVLTVLVTACSEEVTPTYTVGEANNAITLRAGISQQTHLTRAIDGNHGQHTNFMPGHAKAVLRMDGKWAGGNPYRLRTTATMTAVTGTDKKHNAVTMEPVLYWDDFHTADPDNSVGRNDGLEIYGASVNGYLKKVGTGFIMLPDGTDDTRNNLKALLTSSFDDWKQLHWTLPTDQSDGTTITNNDLLTSNNITAGGDGTLKFDDVKGKTSTPPTKPSDLLEFTHAMTHITVELTAGTGFEASVGYTQFATTPSVTLLGFPYVGLVDIINKKTTATDKNFTVGSRPATGNINCFAKLNKTENTSSHTATATALVYPGCAFDDATNVLRIMADGNEYLVTAKKMNEAMTTAGHAKFQQGTNYVFQITVNKTGVDVTATIKEWDEITAENEAPIINFDKCYGHDGTAFTETFSLYRSTDKMAGPYTNNADQAVVSYDNENNRYVMTPQLYWPDHKTHYFFRAIWPKVGSAKGPAAAKLDDGKRILVQNEPYTADQYPSDLRIGMPRKADGTPDETCKKTGAGHGIEGICATDAPDGSAHGTDGKIHLNFRYAMSQVNVKLETNHAASSTNRVTFDEHTTVEILNGYTAGALMLGDGSSDFTGKTPATYTMSKPAADDYTNYLDAIVPQPLTSPAGDLKFRITVGDDAYETVLGIKDIPVTVTVTIDGKQQQQQQAINAWEPGKKYIYTLTITKTGVTVTATIADWETVTADTPIWM